MRAELKSVAETLAVGAWATWLARRMRRGQAVVLAYHNVVPDGDSGHGQTTLHVPLSKFRSHLDRLSETHRIVTVEALLDGSAWNANVRRPLAALTFDDAYSGAVTLGVPELVTRGLPATLFVAPGLLGRKAFWWDVLADRRGGNLPDSLREKALEEEAGDCRRILSSLQGGKELSADLPDSVRSATQEEVDDAASEPGITLASHGWSHLNLTCLSDEELESELRRPLPWLDERWDSYLLAVSYPYGSSSSRVERMAGETGYAAGFRIDSGWLSRSSIQTKRLAIPRINLPSGISSRGFEIRTSGLWPVA